MVCANQLYAPTTANADFEESSNTTFTDYFTAEMLGKAVDAVTVPNSAFYNILDEEVGNVQITVNEEGVQAEFLLTLDMVLKADDVTELPHVQGMAEALGIDLTGQTDMSQMLAEIDMSIAAPSRRMVSTETLQEARKFIVELEEEYIGETSTLNYPIRASFDTQGNLLKVEAFQLYEYVDISHLLPETSGSAYQNGIEQVELE